MTLEEAIKHEEESAKWEYGMADTYHTDEGVYGREEAYHREKAENHERMVMYLKELQAHREAWMKVVSAVDQHTDIHSDGELYIKNFDVKKIIAEYRPKEGDAE